MISPAEPSLARSTAFVASNARILNVCFTKPIPAPVRTSPRPEAAGFQPYGFAGGMGATGTVPFHAAREETHGERRGDGRWRTSWCGWEWP
jgi:hypothetical protein